MQLILHPETLDSLALLLGDGGTEIWAALLVDRTGKQTILSLPNVAASPHAFTVTLAGWNLIEQYATLHQREIVALLHSHQRETTLSRADSRSLGRSHLPWIVIRGTSAGIVYSIYPATQLDSLRARS